MRKFLQKVVGVTIVYGGRILLIVGGILAIFLTISYLLFPSIQEAVIAGVLLTAGIAAAGWTFNRIERHCKTNCRNSAKVHLAQHHALTSPQLYELVSADHRICTGLLGFFFDEWISENGVAEMTPSGYVEKP